MTVGTHHRIDVPVEVAAARVPPALRADSVDVELRRDGKAATWQWSEAGGSGTVRLTALSPTVTRMELTDDGRAPVALTDAVAVTLYGLLERQWAPPAVGSSGAGGIRLRTKILVAAVVVLVPLLALTGMRVLAPPAPMDVASAVTQFRQQGAASTRSASPVASRGDDQERRRGSGSAGAISKRSEPTRGQAPAAARPSDRDRTTAARSTTHNGGARTNQRGQSEAGDRQAEPAQRAEHRQAASNEPTPSTPEEGVYRYATDGYESIDQPSSRHDYPKETATTIRNSECGFTLHWQPLENRWDEMSMCNQGSETFVKRMATHREFYGQENDSQYQCERGTYAWRHQAGATWGGRCADGDAIMQLRGRTIGREPVQVGNETVESLHFIIEGRLSGGDAEGTWRAERWIDPDTGLVLRLEADTHATTDSSVGTVQYREEVSLRLLSTTPER